MLREAKEVGMMTAYHNYLITNLDLHLVDLEEFKYGGTNITSLRLVDPYRQNVQVNANAILLIATRALSFKNIGYAYTI